ncbi:MAG: arginine deiminase family protein [Sphingomicrobium sp.]
MVDGLRAHDRGPPSFDGIVAEHDAYVAALRSAGLAVTVLEPLEAMPDALFVEDPALVFSEGAILLRPGAPSRQAEAAAIAPTLRGLFETVIELPQGFADGGDVLVTPERVLIGRSARTDAAGAAALVQCLARLGRQAEVVEPPAGVLHLKTACSLLDDETVLATPALARTEMFGGLRQVITPDGEDGAANALRINDGLLVSAGYPRTIDLLGSLGFTVVALDTLEIAKLDAGLSCLSLRWLEPAAD